MLKKNIWRRMRYRRENKMMVEKMRKDTERELSIRNSEDFSVVDDFMSNAMISNPVANMIVKGQKMSLVSQSANSSGQTSTQVASTALAAAAASSSLVNNEVVEAAVAAGASFAQIQQQTNSDLNITCSHQIQMQMQKHARLISALDEEESFMSLLTKGKTSIESEENSKIAMV